MKKLLIFILLIFIMGCTACIKRVKPLPSKNTKISLFCYMFRECIYYNTVSKKNTHNCNILYDACRKDKIFDYCKKEKNLLKKISFQHCWDKKK